MLKKVAENLQSVTGALLILLFCWRLGRNLASQFGVIPAMIYYGLQILHPVFFASLHHHLCYYLTCYRSSWTTSATVGIALIGIGKVLGIPVGMVASCNIWSLLWRQTIPHSLTLLIWPQRWQAVSFLVIFAI